ncbi:MAG: RtcB family protein [Methylococcales bacterium]|nr:RtcB family protein [Methylococcales bacterium]MBT7445270.1 RtcB family protein [Methylococcales bacterium]
MSRYQVLHEVGSKPVKAWTNGVPFDENSKQQLRNVATMPFIHQWIAAMPDVHFGKGATIGSVIATDGAIIPAAVGVDIGCGMMAVKTNLMAADLPDNLGRVRGGIERAVPHGRSKRNRSRHDHGAWGDIPEAVGHRWGALAGDFDWLCEKHPAIKHSNNVKHLGTLGTGNHFIELCLDESQQVWVMLHSGSRGVGNRIGTYFIELAKKEMERWFIQLPDRDLAYLSEGSQHFGDYVKAVGWAQSFARLNREIMMDAVLASLAHELQRPIDATAQVVNCHHNYVAKERHYGKDVLVTRKGAVRAGLGDWGIIPGSMGARSFIVQGLGNEESFCSCSHGAGRVMSRTEAKRRVSLQEHHDAVSHVECRQDEGVIDETPSAYKDIDAVMAAQSDLVEIKHTLSQVVCVKG